MEVTKPAPPIEAKCSACGMLTRSFDTVGEQHFCGSWNCQQKAKAAQAEAGEKPTPAPWRLRQMGSI